MDPLISHTVLYLGFIINSRLMTISWPLHKRQDLFGELNGILLLPSSCSHLTPKQVASILSKLRSAIQISPWGVPAFQPCSNPQERWLPCLKLYMLLMVQRENVAELYRPPQYQSSHGDSSCS
jgi:hypothetical protein